jgi:hypothetical protein
MRTCGCSASTIPSRRGRSRRRRREAAAYLESVPPRSFDGFALSNILDGVDAAGEARLLAAVERAARPGAVAVLRSFGTRRGRRGRARSA